MYISINAQANKTLLLKENNSVKVQAQPYKNTILHVRTNNQEYNMIIISCIDINYYLISYLHRNHNTKSDILVFKFLLCQF